MVTHNKLARLWVGVWALTTMASADQISAPAVVTVDGSTSCVAIPITLTATTVVTNPLYFFQIISPEAPDQQTTVGWTDPPGGYNIVSYPAQCTNVVQNYTACINGVGGSPLAAGGCCFQTDPDLLSGDGRTLTVASKNLSSIQLLLNNLQYCFYTSSNSSSGGGFTRTQYPPREFVIPARSFTGTMASVCSTGVGQSLGSLYTNDPNYGFTPGMGFPFLQMELQTYSANGHVLSGVADAGTDVCVKQLVVDFPDGSLPSPGNRFKQGVAQAVTDAPGTVGWDPVTADFLPDAQVVAQVTWTATSVASTVVLGLNGALNPVQPTITINNGNYLGLNVISSSANSLTLNGTLDKVHNLLRTANFLTITPPLGIVNDVQISETVKLLNGAVDPSNPQGTSTFDFKVDAHNEAPVLYLNNGTRQTVVGQTPSLIQFGNPTIVYDPDIPVNSAFETVNPVYRLTVWGDSQNANSQDCTLTVGGVVGTTCFVDLNALTLAQVRQDLATMTYTAISNTIHNDTITIRIQDNGDALEGTDQQQNVTVTFFIDVYQNNIPPDCYNGCNNPTFLHGYNVVEDSVNNPVSVDSTITSSGVLNPIGQGAGPSDLAIFIEDIDATNTQIEDCTVSVTAGGILRLAPTTGASIQGNNTNAVQIQGTIAVINNAFLSLTYTPPAGKWNYLSVPDGPQDANGNPISTFRTPDTLTLSCTDNAVGPNGAGVFVNKTTINILAVNHPPVISGFNNATAYFLTDGAPVYFSALSGLNYVVSDPDASQSAAAGGPFNTTAAANGISAASYIANAQYQLELTSSAGEGVWQFPNLQCTSATAGHCIVTANLTYLNQQLANLTWTPGDSTEDTILTLSLNDNKHFGLGVADVSNLIVVTAVLQDVPVPWGGNRTVYVTLYVGQSALFRWTDNQPHTIYYLNGTSIGKTNFPIVPSDNSVGHTELVGPFEQPGEYVFYSSSPNDSGLFAIITVLADTCSDGVHDGDEISIDCGGSCPGSCYEHEGGSCSDKVQNGDETGVDCGGRTCPACGGGGGSCDDGTGKGKGPKPSPGPKPDGTLWPQPKPDGTLWPQPKPDGSPSPKPSGTLEPKIPKPKCTPPKPTKQPKGPKRGRPTLASKGGGRKGVPKPTGPTKGARAKPHGIAVPKSKPTTFKP